MQTTNPRIVKRTARPLSSTPRGAYGLWEAVVYTADGREFFGGGLSRKDAMHRAELKARRNGGVA